MPSQAQKPPSNRRRIPKERICAGYIRFTVADPVINALLTLGGVGYDRVVDRDKQWHGIPPFEGTSLFLAELLDSENVVLQDRLIDYQAIERILCRSIGDLIAEARDDYIELAKLAKAAA